MRRPGRIREKLAALLTEATGRHFQASNVWPTMGWRRSSSSFTNDSFRWSAASEPGTGACVVLDSYDTMTDCARRGITISGTEVHAGAERSEP